MGTKSVGPNGAREPQWITLSQRNTKRCGDRKEVIAYRLILPARVRARVERSARTLRLSAGVRKPGRPHRPLRKKRPSRRGQADRRRAFDDDEVAPSVGQVTNARAGTAVVGDPITGEVTVVVSQLDHLSRAEAVPGPTRGDEIEGDGDWFRRRI